MTRRRHRPGKIRPHEVRCGTGPTAGAVPELRRLRFLSDPHGTILAVRPDSPGWFPFGAMRLADLLEGETAGRLRSVKRAGGPGGDRRCSGEGREPFRKGKTRGPPNTKACRKEAKWDARGHLEQWIENRPRAARAAQEPPPVADTGPSPPPDHREANRGGCCCRRVRGERYRRDFSSAKGLEEIRGLDFRLGHAPTLQKLGESSGLRVSGDGRPRSGRPAALLRAADPLSAEGSHPGDHRFIARRDSPSCRKQAGPHAVAYDSGRDREVSQGQNGVLGFRQNNVPSRAPACIRVS